MDPLLIMAVACLVLLSYPIHTRLKDIHAMAESQRGNATMSALTSDRMNRYIAGMCYGIGLLGCTQLAFLAFLTMLFRIQGMFYLIPIFAVSIILMLILVADIYFTSRYLAVRRVYISRALLMFNYAHVLFALLFLLKDF